MNLTRFVQSPGFARTLSHPGDFARMVLVEAGHYGMPPQTVAMLDEIGAMLGLYAPLADNQVHHLAASPVVWRNADGSDPAVQDVSHEIVRVAVAQKAQLAFGHLEPGHLVGPAELVVAMASSVAGNLLSEFETLFRWASIQTLCAMDRTAVAADLARERSWELVPDDHVLQPGGPLHETYIKAVRALRRQAIDSVRGDPDTDPRRIAAVLCHRLAASAEAGGAGEGTPTPCPREPASADDTAQSAAERFRRHAHELGHTLPPDAD